MTWKGNRDFLEFTPTWQLESIRHALETVTRAEDQAELSSLRLREHSKVWHQAPEVLLWMETWVGFSVLTGSSSSSCSVFNSSLTLDLILPLLICGIQSILSNYFHKLVPFVLPKPKMTKSHISQEPLCLP